MFIRYPKIILILINIIILVILFGLIEGTSSFYLKFLWGENFKENFSSGNYVFTSEQLKNLYETKDIKPLRKLLERSGTPFENDFIKLTFANQKYRMRRIKNQSPWPPDKKNMNIFFFGGSTTFGYGVLFDQTIPSYSQEILNSKNENIISVYNFEESSYTSHNELLLFRNILFSGFIPDFTVFINGLNDFYAAKSFDHNPKILGFDFLRIELI